MFRKINAKEKIVGWYSSGPKIKKNDIEINEKFRDYNTNPVFVVIKVHESETLGIPTEAYCSVEEVNEEGQLEKNFVHIPSSIDATEAEQVGVEHLLRDIKDVSIGDLSKQISDKIMGLKALRAKIQEMKEYLDDIMAGKYPVNNEIIENLQDIFNLMPNLDFESVIKSFNMKTNDYMHMIYVCSLIRSCIGVHNLINNKVSIIEKERELLRLEEEKKNKIIKDKEDQEKKDKEEKDKKDNKDVEMKDAN
jgi:26S proteasome regulatory subunit N8